MPNDLAEFPLQACLDKLKVANAFILSYIAIHASFLFYFFAIKPVWFYAGLPKGNTSGFFFNSCNLIEGEYIATCPLGRYIFYFFFKTCN